MKKKLITVVLLTIILFSCSSPGNKFLGTWIYPQGENDFYRPYKVVISKNGEDYLFDLYNGKRPDGTYPETKRIGKFNGTSIDVDNFDKWSLIENGTKLLYNGAGDYSGREFKTQENANAEKKNNLRDSSVTKITSNSNKADGIPEAWTIDQKNNFIEAASNEAVTDKRYSTVGKKYAECLFECISAEKITHDEWLKVSELRSLEGLPEDLRSKVERAQKNITKCETLLKDMYKEKALKKKTD